MAALEKERKMQSKRILVFGLAVIFLSPPLFYAFVSSLNPSDSNVANTFPFKAALIDTLGPAMPNPAFNETATNMLKDAGFTVDHYGPEQVTVDFYRRLPTLGYGLIILRVHGTTGLQSSVSFFTSEPYTTTRHTYEQLTDQATQVAPIPHSEGDQTYFGVTDSFIKPSMKGRFQNTIIIAMTCKGMNSLLAEALIKKGVRAYIAWKTWVTIARTDQAVLYLLEHLIVQKQTIDRATTETMNKLGSDPRYNSTLKYHPLEAGKYTIHNITANLITTSEP